MNPVSLDIKNLFVADQIAYYIGDNPKNPFSLAWACGLNYEVQSPVKFITIYDTGGVVDTVTNSNQYEGESVQLRFRAESYSVGWAKARAIRNYLNGKGKITPVSQSYRYEGFFQETPVLPIGKDENGRFLFTVNYRGLRYVTT